MLQELIRQQISRDGFISIPDYMTLCLLHPEHGYYTTRTVFGTEGDFTTAPETSQLFGEMIGVWAVLEWERLGRPAVFQLIELGPGRGTLMRDLLRATQRVVDFTAGLALHFVEASPQLQERQRQSVADFQVTAHWHATIDTLPQDEPAIIIANEFFDALPLQQFILYNRVWHERVIVTANDRLAWSVRPVDTAKHVLPEPVGLEDGTIWEESADTGAIFSQLCRRGEKHVRQHGDCRLW